MHAGPTDWGGAVRVIFLTYGADQTAWFDPLVSIRAIPIGPHELELLADCVRGVDDTIIRCRIVVVSR